VSGVPTATETSRSGRTWRQATDEEQLGLRLWPWAWMTVRKRTKRGRWGVPREQLTCYGRRRSRTDFDGERRWIRAWTAARNDGMAVNDECDKRRSRLGCCSLMSWSPWWFYLGEFLADGTVGRRCITAAGKRRRRRTIETEADAVQCWGPPAIGTDRKSAARRRRPQLVVMLACSEGGWPQWIRGATGGRRSIFDRAAVALQSKGDPRAR
jgi:hypothetical protein